MNLFPVLLLFGFTWVRPIASPQQESATEIIRKADLKMRGNTSYAWLTIRIIRSSWNREMEARTWSKGTQLAMIRIESPVKDKGTVYLKRQKEVWNWIPTIERNIKLPPSMMSQSWMGTDFTNDDLVREFSILEDYTHKLIGEETIGDRNCYKIQLDPKPQAAVVWGKIIAWIDKKDYLELKAEYYDDNNALINLMTGNDIKTLGGRLLPTRIEITPINKKGQKTIMVYKEVQFDQPIPDNFFTVENMKKVQ
ncbi:outer membrane lipoprotein-sorting protein [Flavihumibacter profundi]|uniref:outer membrane lipoprotein-sorting protein n=1 Tax=Flavihumibacter profundi TaxID=2716883 RepID=UPI001CC5DAC5|nr:outer membrane lipoprotein-sorting protein [Flavihumibacter profundi]MBZ5858982.1 outer membrane lipoprotein-sorting protein [Flavihumibacter profundi]